MTTTVHLLGAVYIMLPALRITCINQDTENTKFHPVEFHKSIPPPSALLTAPTLCQGISILTVE